MDDPEYKPEEWHLDDFVDDPEYHQRQINSLKRLTNKFEKIEAGLDPKMSAAQFLEILAELEKIHDKMSIVLGYASLSYAGDTQSGKPSMLLTRMHRLSSEISNKILFFDLWWKNTVDEKNASRLIEKSGELAGHLAHSRCLRKYTLSKPEEKILNTLDATGTVALAKLYDKITAAFEYRLGAGRSKILTRDEMAAYFRSSNPKVRADAYKKLLSKYKENESVLHEIYQNIVLNWNDVGVKIRGYDSPISMRNVANNIDDKTVESLLAVCKKNSLVFQKFFEQKAKMLGMQKLRRYDLYAPATSSRAKTYQYDKSVRLVFESLGRFSPKLEGFARKVFSENHIHSKIRRGKMDGAFCSTLSPKITPYVMVNFTGRIGDVFTLAHELGHAVHSQAAGDRSTLVHDAPLPLAETASTFSELLLYDNMAEKVSSEEQKIMLAEKIDDMYATIMRQAFFTMFEESAHAQFASEDVGSEIADTYMKNLKAQFAKSVDISEDFASEWSYIPHFYHSPFYCYAYSFGNLLALSLFRRYEKEGRDFVPSYISILAAGGSKKPERLLEEHGFDIGSPKFWQYGFDYIKRQVRQLQKLN